MLVESGRGHSPSLESYSPQWPALPFDAGMAASRTGNTVVAAFYNHQQGSSFRKAKHLWLLHCTPWWIVEPLEVGMSIFGQHAPAMFVNYRYCKPLWWDHGRLVNLKVQLLYIIHNRVKTDGLLWQVCMTTLINCVMNNNTPIIIHKVVIIDVELSCDILCAFDRKSKQKSVKTPKILWKNNWNKKFWLFTSILKSRL